MMSERDNPLSPFLREQGVIILDGALATELERRGADLRDPLGGDQERDLPHLLGRIRARVLDAVGAGGQ